MGHFRHQISIGKVYRPEWLCGSGPGCIRQYSICEPYGIVHLQYKPDMRGWGSDTECYIGYGNQLLMDRTKFICIDRAKSNGYTYINGYLFINGEQPRLQPADRKYYDSYCKLGTCINRRYQ